MPVRSILVALLVLAGLAGAAVVVMRGSDAPVLVERPRLIATSTVPGNAMVFMSLRNEADQDDVLIGAVSDLPGSCGFHGPTLGRGGDGMPFIAVPANAQTDLSPETAHIELLGLTEPLAVGQIVPLTLIFRNAGEVLVKARVEDLVSNDALLARTGLYEPAAGEAMPEITLSAEPLSDRRWRISVEAENFTFDEAAVDSPHKPGRGHAHIYIDNVKLGRLYAPDYTTNPLPPGRHTIAIALNTNDHRAYAKGGVPLTATLEIEVE